MIPRLALSLLALSATLCAQDLVPIPNSQSSGRSVNMIPFGGLESLGEYRNQRYQTLIPAARLGRSKRAIREIGFAPEGKGRHIFDRITVRLSQTKSPKLATSFASNLGKSSQLCLSAREYHWHHNKGLWSSIGLERPFSFDPAAGNLVIDIEVRGARGTGTLSEVGFFRADNVQRVYALADKKNVTPSSGSFSTAGLMVQIAFDLATTGAFGDGCLGSNKKKPSHSFVGVPKLGSRIQARLDDTLVGVPAMMLLGASIDSSILPAPLPNTNGCKLYTMPLTITPVTTTPGGTSLAIAIPMDRSLGGLRFYTQFLSFDKAANSTWLVSSNYVRVLVGS
ncbi:MAG: hypothetical protein CSA62_13180 [Planctomycetota bacterium]|nr:MAG: hypothetical protein CSA62_13180 [Planctomycetota bacterium]